MFEVGYGNVWVGVIRSWRGKFHKAGTAHMKHKGEQEESILLMSKGLGSLEILSVQLRNM